MRNTFLVLLGILFIFSGCATYAEGPSRTEIYRLKDRISVLEKEINRKEKENIKLKEEVAELERLVEERTIFKMPTGVEIQTCLKNAGFYEGKLDGQIGRDTKQAIKEFQRANKLNPDGVVGSRTWELLRPYLKK